MSELLRINNKLMLNSNNKLISVVDFKEWQSFYYLTYFVKNANGTLKTYQSGNRVDVTPTSPTTYYNSQIDDHGFGSMNFVNVTTSTNNNYDYWNKCTLTAEQATALKNGAIQIELMYYQTGTPSTSDHGRFGGSNFGTTGDDSGFMFPHIGSNKFEFIIRSSNPSYATTMTSYVSSITTFRNSEWNSFQSNFSNFANKCTHLVCTYSLKDSKALIWLNGVLSAKYTLKASFVTALQNMLTNNTVYFTINPAIMFAGQYVSQWGIREAIWTEEKNYDSPTTPYLPVAEY